MKNKKSQYSCTVVGYGIFFSRDYEIVFCIGELEF